MATQPYSETLDRLLNAEVAPPHEIARLDRIMQYRNAEAMNGLSNKLNGVTETIYRAAQLAQDKADEAIRQVTESSVAQGKQQKAMIGLTVALVACTLVYTFITGWSTHEMSKSNMIQAEVAKAAREQVIAAQEANAIQRQQLQSKETAHLGNSPDHAVVPPSVKR